MMQSYLNRLVGPKSKCFSRSDFCFVVHSLHATRGKAAFCAIEPKKSRHFVTITKRRRAEEFAYFLREIGRKYPNAKKIHVIMDNLNTHREKSPLTHLGAKRG
ncbi:MAG: transposase, partial [Chitinophagaceae bacterium]|nr:transposase [Oligoflexus sp.]